MDNVHLLIQMLKTILVFQIEDDIYVAHKFIIFSRAKGLKEIVEETSDKHIYLNYDGLSSKMFELMMKHIYSNHALTLTGNAIFTPKK